MNAIDIGGFDSIVTGAELEGLSILDTEANDDFDYGCSGCRRHNGDKYGGSILRVIQMIYTGAAIIWIILVYYLELFKDANILIWLLLLIPLIVYGVGFYNACDMTYEIESFMLQSNYLSFGFLITIILLNWNSPIKGKTKNKFFKLLIVAFVFIMLSMIDVWVEREYLSVIFHFKSILQTAALVLLSMALYSYYRDHERTIRKCKTTKHSSEEKKSVQNLEKEINILKEKYKDIL